MVEQERHGSGYNAWPPIMETAGMNMNFPIREDPQDWRHYDNSVNAVSFGFVATAILISMFLIMAIFERFLRPGSGRSNHHDHRRHSDLESQMGFHPKLAISSPKLTVYANGVSVLMPGDNVPTFIAHPAPVPCPPVRISSPREFEVYSHSISNVVSNSMENSSSRWTQ